MCQNLVLRPTFKLIFCLHGAYGTRIYTLNREGEEQGAQQLIFTQWSPSRIIYKCQSGQWCSRQYQDTLCSSSFVHNIFSIGCKKKNNWSYDWNGVILKAAWFQASLHYTEKSLLQGRLVKISLTVSVLQYMLTQLFPPFQYSVQPGRWLCCWLILSYNDVNHSTIPAWMNK